MYNGRDKSGSFQSIHSSSKWYRVSDKGSSGNLQYTVIRTLLILIDWIDPFVLTIERRKCEKEWIQEEQEVRLLFCII